MNWDDLRLFLAVSRAGRFTAASRVLEIDHTTIARRVTALEKAINRTLFTRSPKGVTLTEAGVEMALHAERIEAEVLRAGNALCEAGQGVSGIVRLATPEAFGRFLVAPAAAKLAEDHPRLTLELAAESRLVSLINREADLSVVLKRPRQGRLIARRLTDYRVGLYASQTFLDRHGPIDTLQQAATLPFASYIDNLIELPELSYLHEAAGGARAVFRSSSISAQQVAVANGLGIGLLHVFAAEEDSRLVRLLPNEIEVTRTYWLAMHEDQRSVPRIRAVVDLIDALVADNADRF